MQKQDLGLTKLTKQLEKIEAALGKCRTSVLEDGWQTMRFAKKSRKWDILAQEKMKLVGLIEDLANAETLTGIEKIL